MSHFDTPSRTQSRRRLFQVLLLTSTVLVVELVIGLMTGSLVLLADAGHMFSDVAALGLALFALWFAARPSSPKATFGNYRIEILAALLNAMFLGVVTFLIVREAIFRLQEPPDIQALPVLLTGVVGLLANLVSIRLLHGDAKHSLNVRGAYLEVMADALGSVAVIVSALLVMQFGWVRADPILSLLIAAFILPRIFLLLRDATDILMEAAPRHLDLEALRRTVLQQEGVVDMHDLHVWTITSGRVCLSAHVVAHADIDRDGLIQRVNDVLRKRFDLAHTTLQVEGGEGALSQVGCDPCP
jgi:cobalt-zinc-cadmium efflux system protein